MPSTWVAPVANSVTVPPATSGVIRQILPQTKSPNRYESSYAAGQAPSGTNAPPVIDAQPSAWGYVYSGSVSPGGGAGQSVSEPAVHAPSRAGQPRLAPGRTSSTSSHRDW